MATTGVTTMTVEATVAAGGGHGNKPMRYSRMEKKGITQQSTHR